jgi:K+-sensing histidine kinase KdpD
LIVFEASALVVTRLSTQVQEQAKQAKIHRRESERLYEFSTQLLLLGRQAPDRQILSLIQKVFSIESGVLFDASKAEVELSGALLAVWRRRQGTGISKIGTPNGLVSDDVPKYPEEPATRRLRR